MNNPRVTYETVMKSIVNLKKSGKTDVGSIFMYVLTPQVIDFGYDVYDLNKNVLDFDTGSMRLTVSENINILMSLDDKYSNNALDYETDCKIYVYFSFEDLTYNMYFKVLDTWELVESVDFGLPETESEVPKKISEETPKFKRLGNYLMQKNILKEYNEKGEKYFTEAVLDTYLENKEFNNEFIRTALRNEFEKPSPELITMLASALGKQFTTMSQESVQERLNPLMELGLETVVDSLVNGTGAKPKRGQMAEMNPEDYSFLSKPQPVKPTTNVKKEEPVPVKEVKPEVKSEVKPEVVKETAKPVKPKETEKEDIFKEPEVAQPVVNKFKDLGANIDKKPVNTKAKSSDVDNNGAINLDSLFDK